MKKLESLLLIGTLSCAILFNFISFVGKYQLGEIISSNEVEIYHYELDSGWFWWEESLDHSKKVTLLITQKTRIDQGEYIQIKFDFIEDHGSNLALGEFEVCEAEILWSDNQIKTYSGSDVNLVVDITSMHESMNGLKTLHQGKITGSIVNKLGIKELFNCRFIQVI